MKRRFVEGFQHGLGIAGSFLMVIVAVAVLAVTVQRVHAQLQQSGGAGSAVTAAQGTAAALSSAWPTKITDGTNTMPTGDASARSIHVTADSLPSIPTGTNVIGFVKSVPATTCGATAVTQALAAVPTSSTAVFSSTTCVWSVYLQNSNAGAQTVTLTDNAGTPLNAVGPSFSLPGLSNLLLEFGGIPFASGVKWSAGGTGVLGGMVGYQ